MSGPVIRRRSKVETELPRELRAEVDCLLVEGATYEEIAAFCQGKGYDISKSSVGRYGKEFLQTYREIRILEDQARVLKGEVGDGLALEEAGTKALMRKLLPLFLSGDFDVTELPRLVSDFAKLTSASVQREKWKAEVEKRIREAGEKVAERVEAEGGGAGGAPLRMSAERLREIIRETYGVSR
ncbi:MAG: phage protein Gp27 family protein [Thermodesulfobacteriota bacterium]